MMSGGFHPGQSPFRPTGGVGGDRPGLGWPDDQADSRRQPGMSHGGSMIAQPGSQGASRPQHMPPQTGPVDDFAGFGADGPKHRTTRPLYGGDSAGGEAPKPWARAAPEPSAAAPPPDNLCERCFWVL